MEPTQKTLAWRIYLPAILIVVLLSIVIPIIIWTGNTCTMLTAIARFERTHTVSRVEAIIAFYDYQDNRMPEELERYHRKMAVTQSYNLVFSKLLEMRGKVPDSEVVKLIVSTFSECDDDTAIIIVNRVKLLFWHPILQALVGNAIGAHEAGEALELQVDQYIAAEDEASQKAILAEIQKTRTKFIGYETAFSKGCSTLASQIFSYITYGTIALLVVSIGIIGLLAYQISNTVIQRLRFSSLYARSLIESSLDPLVTISNTGKITDVNAAAEKITGLGRSCLIGTDFEDYFSEPKMAKEGYLMAFSQGQVIDYPLSIRHSSGTITEVLYNAAVFRDLRGEVIGICAVARDITMLKKAESVLARLNAELQVKNKELEQVVYVVSHDLRSPLVNIVGYVKEANFALEELTNICNNEPSTVEALAEKSRLQLKEMSGALTYISNSALQMDALLTGLLKLSRFGRSALDIVPLDMDKLISSVVEANTYQISEAGVKMEITSLPPCLGDSVQVRQVFNNLLSNALKYLDPSREGIVEIGGSIKGKHAVYW